MMESREPTPRVQEALAHYRAGKEHWSRGEWREALNHYLAAIDLDPDGPATPRPLQPLPAIVPLGIT